MIGRFHVASFQCTPIAYLYWSCFIIHVEPDIVTVHDIMQGWKYDLGTEDEKKWLEAPTGLSIVHDWLLELF